MKLVDEDVVQTTIEFKLLELLDMNEVFQRRHDLSAMRSAQSALHWKEKVALSSMLSKIKATAHISRLIQI